MQKTALLNREYREAPPGSGCGAGPIVTMPTRLAPVYDLESFDCGESPDAEVVEVTARPITDVPTVLDEIEGESWDALAQSQVLVTSPLKCAPPSKNRP